MDAASSTEWPKSGARDGRLARVRPELRLSQAEVASRQGVSAGGSVPGSDRSESTGALGRTCPTPMRSRARPSRSGPHAQPIFVAEKNLLVKQQFWVPFPAVWHSTMGFTSPARGGSGASSCHRVGCLDQGPLGRRSRMCGVGRILSNQEGDCPCNCRWIRLANSIQNRCTAHKS
jgi:hypothetical protein